MISDFFENISCEVTGDGSHTIYLPSLDETYHSRNGAMKESQYVYVEQGYQAALDQFSDVEKINVLEIGLGTGLNALLTLLSAANQKRHTHYMAVEKNPLPQFVKEQLNFDVVIKESNTRFWLNKILDENTALWQQLHAFFNIKTFWQDVRATKFPEEWAHVIYFDAFAPNKQADIWQKDVLEMIYNVQKPGGYLVTYSSQGEFQRTLKEVGYEVEKPEGPLGKREMVRAKKRG